MNVKFFGREPAALVGTIQAVLALLISFNLLDFVGLDTDDDLALVISVVAGLSALYLAYVTSETLLAPIIEVIKAGLALGAIYGLDISAEQTGLLIAAVTAIIAGYQRDRVSPLSTPTFAQPRKQPRPEVEMHVYAAGSASESDEPLPFEHDSGDLLTESDVAGFHGGTGVSDPAEGDPALRNLP